MIVVLTEKDLNEEGKTTKQPIDVRHHFRGLKKETIERARLIIFFQREEQKVLVLKDNENPIGEAFGDIRKRYLKIMENFIMIRGENT